MCAVPDISLGQKIHDLAVAYLVTQKWEVEPTVQDFYEAYLKVFDEIERCVRTL